MVKGRGEFEWRQTSVLLATYINANRGKHRRAVNPDELNPYLDEKGGEEKTQLGPKESIEVLRRVFVNGG